MAAFGRIEQFDYTACDIETYIERFDQLCIANEIEEDSVKLSGFLSVIGPKTYILLKSLVAPAKPHTKTYEELTRTLVNHLAPKKLVVAERFRFYNRRHQDGESVSDYVAELQKLANSCDFGTFLDQPLRDKLVCGLRNETLQRKLLSESELSFQRAYEIAVSIELAEKNARDLKTNFPRADMSVNAVSTHRRTSPRSSSRSRAWKPSKQKYVSKCWRCGLTNHKSEHCKYKSASCYLCGKIGHLKSECKSKSQTTKHVELENSDSHEETICLYHVRGSVNTPSMEVTVHVKGKPVSFEVDTGSPVSIMPHSVFVERFPEMKLERSKSSLKSYSDEVIAVCGEALVTAAFNDSEHKLTLIVADAKNKTCILGRQWIKVLKLNLSQVFYQCVNTVSELDLPAVLDRHSSLFEDKLGEIRGMVANFKLKPGSEPKFFKARPVPFALREKVEAELNKLESEGIITKVETSDWATPVVIVPKASGDVRVCGDYKVTLNQCIQVEKHPLPTATDLFATFAGSEVFSKIDLTKAFHQLRVSEETKKLLVVSTHKGLHCYNRLPFGIASCPAIFQSVMEKILQGIDKTVVFQDDIEIGGKNKREHLQLLDTVLNRLEEYGVKVKREKCQFMQDEIKYLGHIIDKNGIRTIPDKVKAVLEAPVPKNKIQLRSFLGMLQYYARFIPRLSSLIHPLNELLKDSVRWSWTEDCDQAFAEAKMKLSSAGVLTHFDLNKPLRIACDASEYGLGAVLSHVMPDGSEQPVAYASRTLSKSERNYAQIEKEALALIFGVKKFHEFLYGQCFTLVTDHKPLLSILGPTRHVPTLAAAGMQRWGLILSTYTYDIEFRKTEEHSNADLLSRLPLDEHDDMDKEDSVFQISYGENVPISADDICEATRKDPVLSRVLDFTYNGWPTSVSSVELKPFFVRRNEISVDQGVLLWGLRVIIPPNLRKRLLNELHADHLGMVRTKGLARSYFWWPLLDSEIEEMVHLCSTCVITRNMPSCAPQHEWTFPSKPWKRVHVDFAEYKGRNYFVLVDAFSKWPEVHLMSSTTTTKMIQVLRQIFSTHGIPNELVSDNGPQFTSEEFSTFLRMNGVVHKRSPPYHPATNGVAERLVQVLKSHLKTSSEVDPQRQLSNFLICYRTTPHSVTGKAPCELLMKRRIRTRFDLLKPNLQDKMSARTGSRCESNRTLREFLPGQSVAVRRFRGPDKWVVGTVLQRLGPVSYVADVSGYISHVHLDHMVSAPESNVAVNIPDSVLVPPVFPATTTTPTEAENPTDPVPANTCFSGSTSVMADGAPVSSPLKSMPTKPNGVPSVPERRYPVRERRPPQRLDL